MLQTPLNLKIEVKHNKRFYILHDDTYTFCMKSQLLYYFVFFALTMGNSWYDDGIGVAHGSVYMCSRINPVCIQDAMHMYVYHSFIKIAYIIL